MVDGRVKAGNVAGVHDELLTRFERVFDQLAVDLDERHARAGQTLHDKALAAEKARAELFVEVDRQLYCLSVEARNALFWSTNSRPGAISRGTMRPGKQEPNVIMPSPRAV